MDRRQFLWASAALAAFHPQVFGRRCQDRRPPLVDPPPVVLRRLTLQTASIAAMEEFYGKTLGLKVHSGKDGALLVFLGLHSIIEFRAAEEDRAPYHHFAFNVPRNLFAEAKAWLTERVPLVKAPDGRDEFHFTSRDADAVYFLDPGGNLGELIAHHRLPNPNGGAFTAQYILGLCEIGIVTPSVPRTVEFLRETLGAQPYSEPAADFAAVGDERGFFIVVERDRLWFPRRERPAVDLAPVTVQLEAYREQRIAIPETQCQLYLHRTTATIR